ncbi:peptidoglycan recognition family protein [Streptomyces sp. RPA4-2]|uniref:N-acetylmuramoyl-L-alanine amidase n=1 Tax=Streptomyces sp. RPA4-2 TaxID=2721244 RepID=UPI00143E5280|nr:peptidoglycan recognition family protein [Streptomyces sp. RPA4-2]QIY65847.1 N-acetylmuramoyl-L-alanine amidase [Streptomyces sp. RPA4-2]
MTASAALLVPLLAGSPACGGPAAEPKLQNVFTDAADEYHVPRSVLMGVSYLQSRWDSRPGAPSVAGGYGPMHLVDTRRAKAPATSPSGRAEGPAIAAGPSAAPLENASGNRSEQPADLRRAALLIGAPAGRLRTDAVANVRGGAALLAAVQRQLGKPLSTDPEDWWDAVARFSGTDDAASAARYADDVFSLIRQGAHRTTDAGERVTLPASPRVRPRAADAAKARRAKEVECPPELDCDWLGAPYVRTDDGSYGNHDLADRPRDQKIDYIVIHDTEAGLRSMLQTVQNPKEPSWHYSISSRDGHVTQHVRTKDMAWHAGNQMLNARSIGIEHEGFLKQPDTWYTEQMYRASARLVRYLAKKYDIPLDRQHILGHDNVPGPTASSIPAMHDDPGPFWDWRHYFDLLGAPLRATAEADSDMVTVLPDYAAHMPAFTGCAQAGTPCAPHGSSAVRLRTEPDASAPLVQDPGRHPGGEASTVDVDDLGSRVSAGQTFAVAGYEGDWTAIWYQGQRAWFKNAKDHPTAVGASGRMVTPKAGLSEVPVYGRALPEKDAYPEGVPEQPESPLPYHFLAGQRYATQSRLIGSHIDRSEFRDTPSPVVAGHEEWYEIQLGHRIAFVRASDVDVVESRGSGTTAGNAAPPRER